MRSLVKGLPFFPWLESYIEVQALTPGHCLSYSERQCLVTWYKQEQKKTLFVMSVFTRISLQSFKLLPGAQGRNLAMKFVAAEASVLLERSLCFKYLC